MNSHRLIFTSILILYFLTACSNGGTRPGHSLMKPKDGLVTEPVFTGKIYLQMRGNPQGPVVFLIHGLGDDASTIWQKTMKKLERDYFVATLDLPGFGKSSKANELYSPENYVKVLHHISETYFDQQPFHLVGHSMGGAISLRYAATYPEDVKTLTLVDAAGILHRLAYTKYLASMGLKMFSGMGFFDTNKASSLVELILSKADDIMRIDPSLLIQTPTLRAKVLRENPATISGLALVLDDFSTIPSKVKAPTRIIWGEEDAVAPLRTGHVLNALIPDSSLHIIPQAGHVPIRTHADEFHALLVKSLQQDPVKSATTNHQDRKQDNVSCHEENETTYSGKIKTLTIRKCQNVLIKDATIGHVIIDNSDVQLENVIISAPGDTAVEIADSVVMMTAGTITGNIAITSENSRLDIAGTRLKARDSAILTSSTTDIIFSLTPVSSKHQSNTILHGRKKLQSDKKP
ncbi:MAG: alpha/beta hydrolase [Gammaproteobacteria bacterium]